MRSAAAPSFLDPETAHGLPIAALSLRRRDRLARTRGQPSAVSVCG